MDPALILFSIQSIIRLGKIGKDALEQHYRDEEVLFPGILDVDVSAGNYVTNFFNLKEFKHYVTGDSAPYKDYWDAARGVVKDEETSIDTLFVLASKIKAEMGVDSKILYSGREASAGITLIKQWAPDKGPLSPLARVAISAGDIALEYIGANPSILSIGGNGEKLLGAFAGNLGEMLPDNGEFGPKERFGERILCTFLKAGFKVINENPDCIMKEEHLKELMIETIKPLMSAFPEDSILEQVNYEKITDALMGPVASTAMTVLAKNPDKYFGESFKSGTIIGSLTSAVLNEAAKDGIEDQFNRDGLIALYKAALGVAVEQPELFIGDADAPEDKLCKTLLANCADKLKNAPFPYNSEIGSHLASAVMDAIAKNAHNFAEKGSRWELTAADLIQEIATDFGKAFDENKKLKTVFTTSQMTDLGRIVLNRVAQSPSMIVGVDKASSEVIKAVAAAMAADDKLLMTGEDWKEILAVAADEAAKNPGRLFKMYTDESENSLAIELMTGILKSASNIFRSSGEASNSGTGEYIVLFGPTLKSVIITVIQNSSGNLKKASENKEKIFTLINTINEFIASNHEEFGSKEYIRIFRKLLEAVLNGEEIPALNLETANNLLA